MSKGMIIGVGVVITAALAFLAWGGVGQNLVYYWSPTEMQAAGTKAVGATIRLGGLVAPGTISRSPDGKTLTFLVTDGTNTVNVATTAIPPQMFREGIGVVVEGTANPDGSFASKRLMVKHDEQYQAPTAGQKPSLTTLDEK